jgi:hypothetical protein
MNYRLFLLLLLLSGCSSEIFTRYQVITLEGDTFDLNVTVLITEDTAFAFKYVRENLDSTATSNDFDARGVTYGTVDGKSPIVWLPHTNDISVINHELLHATINIMGWAGVPLTNDTEEVYTYEMQHLTNEFYKQINKTK